MRRLTAAAHLSALAGSWLGRATLAGASALVYAATFYDPNLAPVAWIALTPLLAAIAWAPSLLEAAALAAVWTALATLGVAGWLPTMLAEFFQIPAWTAIACFAVVILVAVVPYYAAFALWLLWRLRARPLAPLTVGLAWAAVEYARANLWVADPWALLGYSQAGWLIAAQAASIGGPYLVSALMVGVAAALSALAVPALRGRGRSSVALPLAAAAASFVYGAWCLEDDGAENPDPQPVAAVQGAIPSAERFQPELQPAIVDRHLALSRTAIAKGARVVAWPEFSVATASPGWLPGVHALSTASRPPVDLLVGAPSMGGGQRIRNSYFLISGSAIRRYDKVRLMPFSETNPLPGIWSKDPGYEAAAAPFLLRTSAGRAGILLCSEAMHPSYVRKTVALGAQYLVNASVDDWFRSESAARQQLDATRFRAIEQRRDVIRATSSGLTTIIDSRGRILAPVPWGEPGLVTGTIHPRSGETIYLLVGDLFAWCAIGYVVLDAGACIRRRHTPCAFAHVARASHS